MKKWIVIPREILANFSFMVPLIRRLRVNAGRTIGSGSSKFSEQFDRLLPHLGDTKGCRVLELGPGDVLPMAWLMIQAGAKEYIAVDRFGGNVISSAAQKCYGELGAPKEFPEEQIATGQIKYLTVSAEEADDLPAELDLAFSVNVFEHVTNITESFASIFRGLRDGGKMVHIIDLAPHGAWRSSKNQMEFLTVPSVLWSAMGSRRGLPNRFRLPDFVKAAAEVGFRIEAIEPQGEFTAHELADARPRLVKRLRKMSDEELCPRGFLMVAIKPKKEY